jgi:hypothetical protein
LLANHLWNKNKIDCSEKIEDFTFPMLIQNKKKLRTFHRFFTSKHITHFKHSNTTSLG